MSLWPFSGIVLWPFCFHVYSVFLGIIITRQSWHWLCPYLSRWLTHLHRAHNCDYPIHCADNAPGTFHFPSIVRCPAIWRHFQDQSKHPMELWWRQDSQVHDTRLARRLYPSHHHKPFPKIHGKISLLFLLLANFLQQVLNLKKR